MSIDEYFNRKYNEYIACEDESWREQCRLEAEHERIESLLDNLIPCQHCFDSDTEWMREHGQIAVVCRNCGCATGLCDTPDEAAGRWQGMAESSTKPNHSARSDAYMSLVDNYDDGAVVSEEQAHMIMYVLCRIWNNEVPGVRFENGGAKNRTK